MRSLVIGGNGFIGSHLVEELRNRGDDVRVLDPGAPRDDFDWGGVAYKQGALGSDDQLAAALDGVDVVYHAASTTVPSTSNLDAEADIAGNLLPALRLLAGMRRRGVRRIVYFSSGGTVYGPPLALPIPEEHPTNPISSYGIVKLAVEKYLQMHAALHGISPLILRPSNPYGPRQSLSGVQGIIAAFFGCCLKGEPIRIMGDGTIVRDYMYVTDLVRLAAKAGATSREGVYNAGSGQGHSILQIVGAMSEVIGADMDVEYLPARDFDVREVVLDIRRAQSEFDWTPRMSLDDGLASTWRWLRRNDAKIAP